MTQAEAEAAVCGGGGGGGGGGVGFWAHLPLSHTQTTTQIFQNAPCVVHWHTQTSLQSSQCLVCP